MRNLRYATVGLAALALVAASAGAATAAGSSGRSTLSGSTPSWANASHKVGSADGSAQVDFRVYLDNRDGASAQSYATAVSTPGNALYRKFLTAQQYRAQFSPSAQNVAATRSWLKGQGFSIGTVPL
ncbi:MAG TPA: protease pro-enzyme activation domain-containing protein, partial [Mycobacterium sp.]|nr:protease pro-enzyme activation domain-containing protein [Mycobacterium sp.]